MSRLNTIRLLSSTGYLRSGASERTLRVKRAPFSAQ